MTTDELQEILQSREKLSLDRVKEIIYQLKNDCVQYHEDSYKAGFYNGESNAFYICLDLLEKVDPRNKDSIEKRLLILENWQKVRDMRDKIMSLFSSMTYGKLADTPARVDYYKAQINEIFGTPYVDTDSVKQDGKSADVTTVDEPWHEDARRRGEKI